MTEKKTETNTQQAHKKTLRGVVVGVSGERTAKVRVERYVKHPKYGKFIKKSKNYLVDTADGSPEIGSRVTIEECSPVSKMKRFKIVTAVS